MGSSESRPVWTASRLPDPTKTFESNMIPATTHSGFNKVIDRAIQLLNRIRTGLPLFAVIAGVNLAAPLAAAGAICLVLDFLRHEVSDVTSKLTTYVNDQMTKASLTAITAKLTAITRAMEIISNPNYQERSKFAEAITAKNSLIELLQLFKTDPNLRGNSLLASPLLISCCPLYAVLYGYIVRCDPQYQQEKDTFKLQLVTELRTYRDLCIEQRMSYIDGETYHKVCTGNGSVSFVDAWAELEADIYSLEYEAISSYNDDRREWDYRYDFVDRWEGLSYRAYTDDDYISSYKVKVRNLYDSKFNEAVAQI